jgi:hypothetical protein
MELCPKESFRKIFYKSVWISSLVILLLSAPFQPKIYGAGDKDVLSKQKDCDCPVMATFSGVFYGLHC